MTPLGQLRVSAPRRNIRAAAFLFLLALAVRIAATACFGFSTLHFGDSRAYIFAATELVRTGHYPRATEPFYFRAPGYPFFLAAATLGHPERIALDKLVNVLLGALAVCLLAALAASLFRRRSIAMATGIVAALHPGFVSISTDVQSEPLFLLLLLGAGFFFLSGVDRPSSNLAFLSGIALALAALTRPSALLLVLLLAAPLLDRRYPLRVRSHLTASALLGFCLAVSPWVLRNALVYREFLPVNDAAGSAFYLGNSRWMTHFYELRNLDDYERWTGAMFRDFERQTRDIDEASGGSPGAKSHYFVRKVFEERRGDAEGWAKLMLRKVWDWVRPYPNPMFWPALLVWPVGIFYTIAILLAVVGLAAAPRRGVRLFLLAYLLLTMLSHVLLLVVWRYRIPYWDPVLVLYAVFGVYTVAQQRALPRAVRQGSKNSLVAEPRPRALG